MNRRQKRTFAAVVLKELARGSDSDGIEVLRRIAMNSKDIRARLSCIRMLAAEMAANEPPPVVHEAKWKVKKVAP